MALGRMGDAAASADLVARLGDADPYLAFTARQALRRIGDVASIATGLDANDPAIRNGALHTLEMLYDRDAVAALARFSGDADPRRAGAGPGPGVPRARTPQDAPLGRPLVGHPADQGTATGKYRRLGRDAAGPRDAPGRAERPVARDPDRGGQRLVETGDPVVLPALRERFAAEPVTEIQVRAPSPRRSAGWSIGRRCRS